MEKYTKVALTIDEQIELLEGRGLDIPDTDIPIRTRPPDIGPILVITG